MKGPPVGRLRLDRGKNQLASIESTVCYYTGENYTSDLTNVAPTPASHHRRHTCTET